MATKKYVTEKQRKMRVLIAGLLAVVILSAAFITGGILYSNYVNSGSSMRNQIAFKSENYEVNNSMMTYFYLTELFNTYNQLPYFDPTTSLKDQMYSEDSTWFNTIVNNAANTVNGYLYYAEEAKENNFEVEDFDALLEKQMDNFKAVAATTNTDFDTYLVNTYGIGIKESDIRDALKLELYATEYADKVKDDYKATLTAEDYESYYEANKTTLDKIDYRSYTISANVAEGADEATKQAAFAAAKADAEALLAAATDKEAFIAWVSANLMEKNADLEKKLSDEEIKTKAEAVTEGVSISDGSDIATWAVEAGRKEGDTKLVDDGNGNYTIYMLEKGPHRLEDTATVDVRHILIKTGEERTDDEAKALAEEVLAKYEAGEKGEDAFDALAKEYNEDGKSLYEEVTEGEMVATFNDWIFDEARAEGDTDIVKSEFGYHVMYFVAQGPAKWEYDSFNAMYQEHLNELGAQWQEEHVVDVDVNALDALPAAAPATAFRTADTTAVNTAAAVETEEVTDTAEAVETEEATDTAEA